MKHQPLKPLYLSSFVTIDETPEQPAPRQLPANIKQLKRVYRQLREFNEAPVRFNWSKLAAVGALLVVAAAVESFPQAQALYNTPKPPVVKQSMDSDRGASSKLPVAYSDDTVTITFHNCRENAKQHWSRLQAGTHTARNRQHRHTERRQIDDSLPQAGVQRAPRLFFPARSPKRKRSSLRSVD